MTPDLLYCRLVKRNYGLLRQLGNSPMTSYMRSGKFVLPPSGKLSLALLFCLDLQCSVTSGKLCLHLCPSWAFASRLSLDPWQAVTCTSVSFRFPMPLRPLASSACIYVLRGFSPLVCPSTPGKLLLAPLCILGLRSSAPLHLCSTSWPFRLLHCSPKPWVPPISW